MSDLREQAERMVKEIGFYRSGQAVAFLEDGIEYRHLDPRGHWLRLYELAVRLQVELLAEKESK